MKEHDNDALARAIVNMKEQGCAAAPPQDVVNETLRRVVEADRQMPPIQEPRTRLRLWSVTRWAVAAAVLLASGYATGRITAHTQPDIEQLQEALRPALAASLEPEIRQSVLEEARRDTQRAMVAGYVRMKDELTAQYRADLDRFAVQTFTASNAVTNQLLEQLVEAVQRTHQQDRQWVAAALAELEAKRREDTAELGSAFVDFATQTNDKIEEFVHLLANTQTDASKPTPDPSETIN